MKFASMECNEVFSVSRSAMLGRKHGLNAAGKKEIDRMLWDSPPVGSLQPSAQVSNGADIGGRDTGKQPTSAVRYRPHQHVDDEVAGSPVELCDVAVLKITDATTTSVGPTLSTVLTEDANEYTSTSPPSTPPADATTDAEVDRRRLSRWLDLCHCERHLIAIKVFYFTFIGALGVVIAFCTIFLKQVGLSAFQIGIISGIRPILGFVSAPAWGAMADRYNIRRVLMLVSMFAWLAFFSGLYFIEAPTRRSGSFNHAHVGEQANATTEAATMTAVPNGSVSGTIVDVRLLYVTGQNTSTAATMYVPFVITFKHQLLN